MIHFSSSGRIGGILLLLVLMLTLLQTRELMSVENPVQPQILIPVEVHLLSFEAAPSLDSTFDNEQVYRLFDEVNKYWKQAGIKWEVKSIVRDKIAAESFPESSITNDRREFRKKLSDIASPPSDPMIWQVDIFRKFPIKASGLYIREKKTVFFAEKNKNDEYQPVVLAHELGHSLNLHHVKDPENLMYGGADKKPGEIRNLDAEQIAIAREQALKGPAHTDKLYSERRSTIKKEQDGYASTNAPKVHRREKLVKRLLSMDRNGNGEIEFDEVPPRAHRVFRRIDLNGNGVLEKPELDDFLYSIE